MNLTDTQNARTQDAQTQDAQSKLHSLTQGGELYSDSPLFFIDAKGEWFYRQGRLPEKFSRLFCSILHCIDGQHYLITPVEKCLVEVAGYPLLILDYELQESGQFLLTTSIGTEFTAEDVDNFVIEEQTISLQLDRGLRAKLDRACYYRFVEQFVLTYDE